MIVLDTNVVSEVLRSEPEPAVLDFLSGSADGAVITAVTAAELAAGVAILPAGARRRSLEQRVGEILRDYSRAGMVLSFDWAASRQYARIISLRRRQGRPIGTARAQIAAICAAHGAACATRNVKDFEGLDLDLIDPWR